MVGEPFIDWMDDPMNPGRPWVRWLRTYVNQSPQAAAMMEL
jgi:hypothetical protein